MLRSSRAFFRLINQRTPFAPPHLSTHAPTPSFTAYSQIRAFKMSAPAAEPTLYKDEVTGEMISKSCVHAMG